MVRLAAVARKEFLASTPLLAMNSASSTILPNACRATTMITSTTEPSAKIGKRFLIKNWTRWLNKRKKSNRPILMTSFRALSWRRKSLQRSLWKNCWKDVAERNSFWSLSKRSRNILAVLTQIPFCCKDNMISISKANKRVISHNSRLKCNLGVLHYYFNNNPFVDQKNY